MQAHSQWPWVIFAGRGEDAPLICRGTDDGSAAVPGGLSDNRNVWTIGTGEQQQDLIFNFQYMKYDAKAADGGYSGPNSRPKSCTQSQTAVAEGEESGSVVIRTEDDGSDADTNDTVVTILCKKIPQDTAEVVGELVRLAEKTGNTKVVEAIKESKFAKSLGGLLG